MEQLKIHTMTQVISEAMPYIQNYKDKIIVVKYGGHAMTHQEIKESVMSDLITLTTLGIRVVLVHGGGPEISSRLKEMGKQSRFINGLRYTDKETIEIVQQMLAGKVNKDLVALLKGYGIGLCGIDGGMLLCQKIQSEEDLGYVGEITKVNCQLLHFALNSGFIPVVATIGADENGTVYNINADTAACKIACALGATKIISMTDVAGILQDKHNEASLITEIEISAIAQLIEEGTIEGGMIPKVLGCVECLYQGVHHAAIIDGRVPHSLLLELFSRKGNGTLLYKKER